MSVCCLSLTQHKESSRPFSGTRSDHSETCKYRGNEVLIEAAVVAGQARHRQRCRALVDQGAGLGLFWGTCWVQNLLGHYTV